MLWRGEDLSGGERLALSGEDGEGHRLAIAFGPAGVVPHLQGGGLPWRRGGREWGTRLLFSHPGCWRLRVALGEASGTLAVRVRSAA